MRRSEALKTRDGAEDGQFEELRRKAEEQLHIVLLDADSLEQHEMRMGK